MLLFHQLFGKGISKPAGEGSGGAHAGCEAGSPFEEIGCGPKAPICQRLVEYLDHKEGGPIHEHELARSGHTYAQGFSGGVGCSGGDEGSLGQSGLSGCFCGNGAYDLIGPGEAGETVHFDDASAEHLVPPLCREVVTRSKVNTGEVVDHVFAGETSRDETGRGEEFVGLCVYLGFVFLQPQDLGADRLGGERVGAAVENRIFSQLHFELSDFSGGSGVDAVENPPTSQRAASLVDGQQAGSDGATGDRFNLAWVDTGPIDERLGDVTDISPPDRFCIVLGPTLPGNGQLVPAHGLGNDPTVEIGEHPLGLVGAHVDAHQIGHDRLLGP